MWYRGLTVFTILLFLFITTISAQDIELPEGEGKETVRKICSLCHGLGIVVSQRLNKEGWNDIVERMIKWGAPIGDGEKRVIVDYLSKYFGEK